MADHIINWTNGRNQILPVKYVAKNQNPAIGIDPAIMQKHVDMVGRVFKNVDLSKATDAVVFRDPTSPKFISGVLEMKDGNAFAFDSTGSSDSTGVSQILNRMGRFLKTQQVAFAGKAPAKAPAKQPLSLMA